MTDIIFLGGVVLITTLIMIGSERGWGSNK